MGGLSFEHPVEGVVRDWAAHNPLEVEAVKKAAKSLLERRGYDKGRTVEGYFKGGMPSSLAYAMRDAFGVDWKRDDRIHAIFWRTFTIGRFNTYETWRH